MTRVNRVAAVGLLLLLAGVVPRALGQSERLKYGELLRRVPDQANVLALVDVDLLLDSKIGVREGWRKEWHARGGGGLGLSDEIRRLVVATSCDLPTLEDRWKLVLGEMRTELPDLKVLAAREGGYVENVRTIPVVWTPRGFFLFTFAPRTIGFASQVDRQVLSRWGGSTLSRPRTYPPGFADRAFFRAEGGAPVVIAVNLDATFSQHLIEPWLRRQDSVRKAKIDVPSLASRLADVESAFIEIDADENLRATLHVDFRIEVDMATPVFKELVVALLEDRGASLAEMSSWRQTIAPTKKSFELGGRIGVESLKKILSFAQPPALAPPSSSRGPGTVPGPAPTPTATPADDIVKASQRYFRAVVDKLDGLKQEKTSSYGRSKVWYERYARQIEELPILGVDGDLLDWGDLISRTLREMAFGINYSVRDQNYRMAQHANGSYGGYDGYVNASSKSYDAAALKRASDSVLSVDLDGRWQRIQLSIAETRRKMVAKYKVDF